MSDTVSESILLLRQLLDNGYNPSGTDLNKHEALIWAVRKNKTEFVQILISEGADVNFKSQYDEKTACHFAAERGYCDILGLLHDASADFNSLNTYGQTPLHIAAMNGRAEAVTLLSKSFGAQVTGQDYDGWTPLHWAARYNECEVVKLLLHDLGAEIEQRDHLDLTALHRACLRGALQVVEILLDMNADLAWTDEDGNTPLHLAVEEGETETASYLLKRGADISIRNKIGRTALHSVAAAGKLSTLEGLIQHGGFDMEEKDDNGATALCLASYYGNAEVVHYLVNQGASLDALSEKGLSSLHLAVKANQQEVARYLLERGANIEIRSSFMRTPLSLAVRVGNLKMAQFLIKQHANLDVRDYEDSTLLHLAVRSGNKPMVHSILDLGCDTEAKSKFHRTPLSRAAELGFQEIVSFLVLRGADKEAEGAEKGREGWRPLHYAAYNGHTAVVKDLLGKGADPTAEDMAGHRAQYYADDAGHEDLADILRQSPLISQRSLDLATYQSLALFISFAKAGDLDQITRRVQGGTDLNSMDLDGTTAIAAAAQHGQVHVVEYLINSGAELAKQDSHGHTPLYWAARYGHRAVAQQLLAQGASTESADSEGQTPLSIASWGGHDSIVELLIEKGCNVNSTARFGRTPLFFAVARGHGHVVRLLLNAGANVNAMTSDGETALSRAEKGDSVEIVELLQERQKADQDNNEDLPSTKDSVERSEEMLSAAMRGRAAEVLRLVSRGVGVHGNGVGDIPLVEAASLGHDSVISVLIRHGADVRKLASGGATALHEAAWGGHVSTIRLLCGEGAIIDCQDDQGRTPLIWASESGQEEVVRALLDLGAKKEVRDMKGKTSLNYAAKIGNEAIIIILLDRGANIECADRKGYTPLSVAVEKGHSQVARLLLERGAFMRPVSNTNCSPLCLASCNGDDGLVELLIENGAQIDHLSDNCETPLIKAARNGHTMIVRILIEMGARHDMKDDDGRTALSYAKENGHESIVALLCQAKTTQSTEDMALYRIYNNDIVRRMPYRYPPLSKKKGLIRLLELHPGKVGDAISVEIVEMKLSKAPYFEALSYEWKENAKTVSIQCGQRRILVTPNCRAALENLRLETQPRSLWIDAICINQDDKQELNDQVAMMITIFRKAQKVLMWIGKGNWTTEAAFAKVPVLSDVHKKLQKKPTSSIELFKLNERPDIQAELEKIFGDENIEEAISNFYWASYFERVWILQEIVIAGDRGVVVCGKHTCAWRDFKSALLVYEAYTALQNQCLRKIAILDDQFSENGKVKMSEIIAAMSKFGATDPRDKVFATLRLGSMRRVQQLAPPKADYELDVRDVYVDAARYFTSIRKWVPWELGNCPSRKVIQGLPSWVPDFSLDRQNASASGAMGRAVSHTTVRGKPTTTQTALRINGCILDEVLRTWPISSEADFCDLVKSILNSTTDSGSGLHDSYAKRAAYVWLDDMQVTNCDAILRALLVSFGDDPEQDKDIAGFVAWKMTMGEEAPATAQTVPESLKDSMQYWQIQSSLHPDYDLDIYKRIEDRLREGEDFVYTATGQFGFAAKGEAQKGMKVALVGGANKLCLLRERKDDQDSWYEYVDNIYMSYVSKGLRKLDDTSVLKIERLEIR